MPTKDVHNIGLNLQSRKDVRIATSYERSEEVRLKDVIFMSLVSFFSPAHLEISL